MTVELVRTVGVQRFWSAVGNFWRALPVKELVLNMKCFFLSLAFILNLLYILLFMEEVVEYLVMETAPPCCLNGVYWSDLVCVGLHREVALFLVVGILIQRAKELKKHRCIYYPRLRACCLFITIK